MSSQQQILLGSAEKDSPVYVDDVFNTDVWNGASGDLTINNGIKFSTEGGMFMSKTRSNTTYIGLFDTVRGASKRLRPDSTAVEGNTPNIVKSFNANGLTISSDGGTQFYENGQEHVGWSFRKQKGFFDIQTWTGDNTSGRVISHDLGSVPGMIIIKALNSGQSWSVWHRGMNGGTNPHTKKMLWNSTAAENSSTNDFISAPTATSFELGSDGRVNQGSNTQYIAYIFAHDDQQFGTNKDKAIIKCGHYTGNGGAQTIDLGFEPQWMMIKRVTNGHSWMVVDCIRGVQSYGGDDSAGYVVINDTQAEVPMNTNNVIGVYHSGILFQAVSSSISNYNGDDYIYVAIRRPDGYVGRPAETGTDVFHTVGGTSTGSVTGAFTAGFPVDFGMCTDPTIGSNLNSSIRQFGTDYWLRTHYNDAVSDANNFTWDSNTGWVNGGFSSQQSWMWKRGQSFDTVCYKGNNTNTSIPHGLGQTPEMIIYRRRDAAGHWIVYHKDTAAVNARYYPTYLNGNSAGTTNDSGANFQNYPTATHFKVANGDTNINNAYYAALLFSSVEGISKVGYYNGSSSTTTLSLGFEPRFLMVKRVDATGDWYFWDSIRGIQGTATMGESVISTAGSGTWTCPTGVSSVSVVCVGAGGRGHEGPQGSWGAGGGGGLGYKNNISVSAGTGYSYNVGATMATQTSHNDSLTDTWFISTSTVQGEGGTGAGNSSRCVNSSGGSYTGDGGGNGGIGGKEYDCGAGGAGGYSGSGGRGGDRIYNPNDNQCGWNTTANNTDGAGGGGGGGYPGTGSPTGAGGGGGGVGIFGQGSNGAKGTSSSRGGKGGSGGVSHVDITGNYPASAPAGAWGAGSASSGYGGSSTGGGGVIRIVWSTDGTTRSFPSTNVSSLNDKSLKFNSGNAQTDADYMAKTTTSVILNAGHSDINVNGARYIYYAHA